MQHTPSNAGATTAVGTAHQAAQHTLRIGQLHQVYGRRLMLDRDGSGPPSVVFLPGAGLTGLDYLNLHRRTAQITTSVIYDRAGTGWSAAANWPRTATEVVDELAELLHVANIPTPYVLVGHSLGGAYARRFAQRHPDHVAGMVLLEPLHEDWDTFMPEALRLTSQSSEVTMPDFPDDVIEQFRTVFSRAFREWPPDLRDLLVQRHLDPTLLRRGLEENRTASNVIAELRSGGPVPNVALIVMTTLGVDPGQDLAAQNEAKLRLYARVAASVPGAEHRVLDSGGHSSIQTDRPDDIARSIRDVLQVIDLA